MVKKKGGRELNPVDAFRKAERAKQVNRNKKERHLQREALSQSSDLATLREQLKEVLDAEQAGNMNPTLRLKKKALQQAYDQAIKKKMAEDNLERAKAQATPSGTGPSSVAGVPSHEGLPPLPAYPPGGAAPALPPLPGMPPSMPFPPPPPGGPAWRPPHAPMAPSQMYGCSTGHVVLPPPPGPPPNAPGHMSHAVLPPPPMPPRPVASAPPAAGAVSEGAGGVSGAGESGEGQPQAIITGKSTVVALPKAQHDRKVTSMVPASVLVRRQPKPVTAALKPAGPSQGFGLVPRAVQKAAPAAAAAPSAPSSGGMQSDKKGDDYDAFMASMRELGAL